MQKRSLVELLSGAESAWPMLEDWFGDAANPVEVLPAERSRGEATLLGLQVTDRSPLGAVALETGGILFDRGWLRVLGSGGERMRGTLLSWNGMGTIRSRIHCAAPWSSPTTSWVASSPSTGVHSRA